MSVNGVTGAANAYSTYAAASNTDTSTKADTAAKTEEPKKETTSEEAGAVYEPSKDAAAASTKKYKPDAKLIAKLKADADARTAQFKSMVEQMMSKQTNTFGKATNMWRFLASGDYTVDPATKAQAQADIAEDGYWGVDQTSQRILDFANALTGGDPKKIEEMRSAFQKGYKQAEKTWGGSLPDISKRTYDAVMSGFDKMAEDAGIKTEE